MTTPDRPSAAAIAQAFVELGELTGPKHPSNSYAWVMSRARELDAARPASAGRLPPLPEPASAHALAAWGPKPDYFTADQMHAYAADAVRLSHTWPTLRDDAAPAAPAVGDVVYSGDLPGNKTMPGFITPERVSALQKAIGHKGGDGNG